MTEIRNRNAEILQSMQDFMKECFQKSCLIIEKEIELHAFEIWDGIKNAIDESLKHASEMQSQQKKGELKYLAFSLLSYGLFMDRLEMRVDAMDDGFYLDVEEAAGYYQFAFLQDKYLDDLEFLYKKAHEKFIRLQNHELEQIKRKYAEFYFSIIYRIMKSLSELITETVLDSGISVAEDFKVIFGEYMDQAVILYTGEKKDNEIFSDRNG